MVSVLIKFTIYPFASVLFKLSSEIDVVGCTVNKPSYVLGFCVQKGFTAVGVSMDISYESLKDANETSGRVRPCVAEKGINYPIAMGDDAISKAYALHAFPAT